MKPKIRDNLIYLTVGLSIAGVVTLLTLRAENRGEAFVLPSRFAFRAVTTMLLAAYFVVREARIAKANLAEIALSVLFACLLHFAISFSFPQVVGELPGIAYVGFVTLEICLIVGLFAWVRSYSKRHKPRSKPA